MDHPRVLPAETKELQFFTKGREHVTSHFGEYLERFPQRAHTDEARLHWPELDVEGVLYDDELTFSRKRGTCYVTGEASVDTLCDGDPILLKEFLPELRLVVIMREPVARAFSHHRMFQRFADEGRDLPREVLSFDEDMELELRLHERGKETLYLQPGLYAENLRPWLSHWGPDAIELLFVEELSDARHAHGRMADLLTHLRLEPHDFGGLLEKRFNRAPQAVLPGKTAEKLRRFYAPANRALATLMKRELPSAFYTQ